MKEITLTNGMKAQVDDEDYERVIAHGNWNAEEHHGNTYAKNQKLQNSKNVKTRLHRFVMNAGKGDPDIDHIDGNGLNNQKSNLRFVNQFGNSRNCKGWYADKYKGVFANGWGKFQARITAVEKDIYLGTYATEIEAAYAYNVAAKRLHGEHARLNDIDPNFSCTLRELGPARPKGKYWGVSLDKRRNKWRSRIKLDGKEYMFGYFDSEEEAARVYDVKAREILGDKARQNFPS